MADNKFSYMDMPLQIGFQFAGPLDKYVQFDSIEEANSWKNDVLAYEGALVRVRETEVAEDDTVITKNWLVLKTIPNKNYNPEDSTSEKFLFVPASDIEVVDGKINNQNLNTTINCAEANKIVVTNSEGLIDRAILGVTANEVSGYGKVVITNKSGLVDPALLGVAGITDVGGSTEAGKLVKLGADGKLPESMIPSVAIGDYLGQFETWDAYQAEITAGTKHAPENGDTIEVAEYDGEGKLLGYSVYICVNDEADGLSDKFTTVKSAAGAVTEGAFQGHVSDKTIHITAEERAAWNAKLDEVQVTDTDGINLEVAEDGTVATITATLNPATKTTIGGVIVGNNIAVETEGKISVATAATNVLGVATAGNYLYIDDTNAPGKISAKLTSKNDIGVVQVGENIDVNNGVISVATATEDVLGVVKTGDAETTNINISEGIISVNTASEDARGVVQVGTNINVDTNGVISVNTANGDTLGVVKQGTNVTIVDGAVNVATASKDVRGVVQVGNNIDVDANGKISVALADEDTFGLVKIGSGLTFDDNGAIVANILWTEEKLELTNGAGEGDNKYHQWEKVCEVKIFDENGGIVYPAEYIVDSAAKTTRIEFPADFPADGEQTAKWTVLVGPAIQ